MAKIVAGLAGGLPLKHVPGTTTRPTTERTKEAIFSWLASRDWLEDNAVLDLYAGSGGLAVEAASRGATRVVGVESARPPARIAQDNAKTVNDALTRRPVPISNFPSNTFLATTQRAAGAWIMADQPTV